MHFRFILIPHKVSTFILSAAKIMQGECNSKTGKRSFTILGTAEQKLVLSKIMQDECNGKTGKLSFTSLDIAEPKLILYKDNANERKENSLFISRVRHIFCKDSIFY